MSDALTRRQMLQTTFRCLGAVAAVALVPSLFGRAAWAQAAQFDQRETQIIRDYYRMEVEKARANRGKGGGVPAGLPRKDELPPGLARAIRANALLPPGIAKKGLPPELERSLPLRPTLLRLIAGDKVMLVDAKNTVRDIIEITDILERLYSR